MTADALTPESARRAVAEALRQAAPDVDIATIGSDEDLRDAAQLDSLDFLVYVENLSTITGVRVDEADYPAVRSVAGAVAFLCPSSGSAASTPG